jgi:PleD family two-component response regulator
VNLLVVMADLFFSATIIDIAKKLGMTVQLLNDREMVLKQIKAKPLAVIFDLNFAAVDPIGLIQQIRANPETQGIRTIGFVSHVQVELKSRAEKAGCDVVLPRSAFVQKLRDLLQDMRQ